MTSSYITGSAQNLVSRSGWECDEGVGGVGEVVTGWGWGCGEVEGGGAGA